jgi:hypothetical protein
MQTTRSAVYAALDGERDYQDAGSGNAATDNVDSNTVAGALVLLDQYVQKAKAAYAGVHPAGRIEALSIIRKVTAIGVRAMEVNGAILR